MTSSTERAVLDGLTRTIFTNPITPASTAHILTAGVEVLTLSGSRIPTLDPGEAYPRRTSGGVQYWVGLAGSDDIERREDIARGYGIELYTGLHVPTAAEGVQFARHTIRRRGLTHWRMPLRRVAEGDLTVAEPWDPAEPVGRGYVLVTFIGRPGWLAPFGEVAA